MRKIYRTEAFDEFFESLPDNVKEKAILFTIDHENIVHAEQILLLNGFMKKSTKDYKKEIQKAQHILACIMRKKIDMEKIQKLSTTEDMFQQEYGPKGTARCEEFEDKARARYYADVLRDARKTGD